MKTHNATSSPGAKLLRAFRPIVLAGLAGILAVNSPVQAYQETHNGDYILALEVPYSNGDWQAYFNAKTNAGYRPVWYDIYYGFIDLEDGQAQDQHYINAIFRKSDGMDWSMRSNLSEAQFQTKTLEMDSAGYRLIHIESWNYKVAEDYGEGGGTPRFGGIWEDQQITDQAAYTHEAKVTEQVIINSEVEDSFRLVRRNSHTASTVPNPGEVNFAPADHSMMLFEFGALTVPVDTSESLGVYYAEQFDDDGFTLIDWERYYTIGSNPQPEIEPRYSIIGRQGFADRDKWLTIDVTAGHAVDIDQYTELYDGRPAFVRGRYDYGTGLHLHTVYWVEEIPVAGDGDHPGGLKTPTRGDEHPYHRGKGIGGYASGHGPQAPDLEFGTLHYFPAKKQVSRILDRRKGKQKSKQSKGGKGNGHGRRN